MVLAEQDAVAQEGESGTAVHLRLIILVLVFTPSVRPLWNGRVTAAVTAARVPSSRSAMKKSHARIA